MGQLVNGDTVMAKRYYRRRKTGPSTGAKLASLVGGGIAILVALGLFGYALSLLAQKLVKHSPVTAQVQVSGLGLSEARVLGHGTKVGTLPGPGPAILIGAHYDTEYHPR